MSKPEMQVALLGQTTADQEAVKTPCKGDECPFYVEFWSDVDKIGAGCSHPEFDEMKHSIKFGPCPFVTLQAQNGQVKE
jgi:hypothetical protein